VAPHDLNDVKPSRFVVGIDLGTTNSAVGYVDTDEALWQVRTFAIIQLIAPGQVESRDTLPSFHFQPLASEDRNPTKLPWQARGSNHVVGVMARDEGQAAPSRLIASAKSWLCHPGVDRTADLLPWHGADDVERLSPIEVSARYLRHLREAWDAHFPGHALAEQDVVLTLPASFDEVARELTVQAAAQAGLSRVVLIEEPQAAFYSWVDRHRNDWQQRVATGQKILVCDIGGGTSDFTLIRVRQSSRANGDQGSVQFHRIAVGEHLILGGDNLDLALARLLERRLTQATPLTPRQWDVLVRTSRQVKETLLGQAPPDSLTVNLPGSGSRLIGGGLQVSVQRDEVERELIEGFFPRVPLDCQPRRHQSGFREFGLPYASEPAATCHLASFLTAHRHADAEPGQDEWVHDPARPDLVLFNGGVFAAPLIQERLLTVIAEWFRSEDDPNWSPIRLDNDRLDLAVAHGAAYYGMVRRGEGVRIAAGLARSYYLEVGNRGATGLATAVCVVPGSAQPGETIDLPNVKFDLLISEPAEFPLHVSSTRLTDRPGQSVDIDPEQMRSLPPLRTALRTQRRNQRGTVPVELHAHLSEIGTIELWCSQADGDRRWRLQFDVRAATETDRVAVASRGESQGVLDEQVWDRALQVLRNTFGPGACGEPGRLMNELTEALGMHRGDWPMSLLRRIWEALMQLNEGRRLSQQHEARWLNLLGYALRPGEGMAVDDWRVTETWRNVQGKLVHHSSVCRNESWVLWRRIAAGLPAGHQRALAEPLSAAVRALHRRMIAGSVKGEAHFAISEFAELWRLLGSLEWLSVRDKSMLGDMLVELLPKRKLESVRGAIVWTLGRLGSRVPFYGPLNTVVDASSVAKWARALMRHQPADSGQAFALMQMARHSGDRYRDLPHETACDVARWLDQHEAPARLLQLVREGGTLDEHEQQQMFGESLPKGLQLRT
jgi:molecular chaperone DnaK (HSP70)